MKLIADRMLAQGKSKKASLALADINLLQSSVMCIDTLARSLGKNKDWQAAVIESLKENIDFSREVFQLSVNHPSSHELMKLLGTIYLCCSTQCASIGVKALPLLGVFVPSMLDSLAHYNSIELSDSVVVKGRVLLIRSILSALASVVFELPSFSHPYMVKILKACMDVYSSRNVESLPKPEQESLKRDIDRCMGVLVVSVPSRLLIPAVLNGMADIMGTGHSSAKRFCEFLGELWQGLTRDTVTQFMPQLNSMATLVLDYRRALGDGSPASDAVDTAAVDAIIELSMKFTEIELRSFLARLAEWRDIQDESASAENDWKVDARPAVFYRLGAKLGLKLKSIFVPTVGIFWENMKESISDFVSAVKDIISLQKKGKKRKIDDEALPIPSGALSKEAIREKYSKCSMILECIKNCCMFGTVDFMDEARYDSIMPEVLSLLPVANAFDSTEEYLAFVDEILSPCISALAVSIGKDVLWKPLNHRVLMSMRDKRSSVRFAALKTLHKLFTEVLFNLYKNI